jgi:FG-GAP-like repeat
VLSLAAIVTHADETSSSGSDQGLPTTAGDSAGLMSLDPREDGWSSEHTHDVVSRRLAMIADYLHSHQSDAVSSLEPLSDGSTVCGSLVPELTSPELTDNNMSYFRMMDWDGIEGKGSHQQSLAGGLQSLFMGAVHAEDIHVKFKVIRIGGTTTEPETEQLVSISFRDGEHLLESQATWKIVWNFSQSAETTTIKSLTASNFELVRYHAPQGTLFSDQSSQVFANEKRLWVDQYGVGIGDWVRRLEGYLETYQYGHNGLALGDVNGDGLDDLYSCQTGGLPNRLFLANQDGTVRDHSKAAGVDFLDNTQSALLIDLDNDADQDLVLATSRSIVVLANDGNGKFQIVAELPQAKLAYSLAASDFDLDGDLDLYACVYYAEKQIASELPIPMPMHQATNGGRNVLFRNDGGWTFRDVTEQVGLDQNNSRFSYAAVWDDLDNDGDDDLFVANDFGRNNYYRNDGGTFVDTADTVGMNDHSFGMSAATADYDRNGWIDVYKANMFSSAGNRVTHQAIFMPTAQPADRRIYQQLADGNTLYQNHQGRFQDVARSSGVNMGRWSWGSIFLDINSDGWDDLYVTNGFVTGPQKDDL